MSVNPGKQCRDLLKFLFPSVLGLFIFLIFAVIFCLCTVHTNNAKTAISLLLAFCIFLFFGPIN